MPIKAILEELDAEIARLEQARAILTASTAIAPPTRGRPKKVLDIVPAPAKKKRKLTPEGRARIAEAVKRRWATQKKAKA